MRFGPKSLLLVAFWAALAGAGSAFEADKVYRYDFEGSISSRVADDERPQQSGYALSSALLVKRRSSSELVVQLERPQSATFNELPDEAQLRQYRPVERAAALDRPFRIYYEDGAVKAFDTYKEEPKWVTNLKRGLLAFFQLKLEAPEAAAAASAGASQFYTTSEKSVFGECETDYLVSASGQEADGQQQQYLNVTKTRNMAKCKTRFLHRFMPIDASECYENERDLQQYKHSNAIFQFELAGSRRSYVIQRAHLDELATFSPFGRRAHSHLVASSFQLRLNRTEAAGSLEPHESATSTESLSYDPPELLNFYANVNLDEAHHLANIYQTSASVEQAMGALEALVEEHRAYLAGFERDSEASAGSLESSRLAELFIRLNELVGSLNAAKIEQLYGLADERGETHKKLFWDVMSVAGTNPAFVFMKKLITEGDAPSVKIKDFLTRLSYHIKMPSKSLFDEYVNLCKSDKVQANQQYKRLCSLPLASLLHQHCAKPHAKYLRMQQEGANATPHKKAQNTCQIATAEEYFSRLVSGWAPSSAAPASSAASAAADELSIGDKLFNIKMAGELGVRPSIDFLMEVVGDRDEHPALRAAAMWNLQKVSRIYPNQVKRLVIPRYYDQSELLEVRIAAFYNWFFAGLSLHEMETLAKQLESESSRQLVIYIHSMMKSLAATSSALPCSQASVASARLVLASLGRALERHPPASLTDSQASFSSSWQPDFGYGTATIMSAIFSNDSMAPTNLFYSTSELMSGLKLSPMSVSLQAHGLDKLIKRVAGINGLLADKESFMDVFSLKRRSKRQASSEPVKQEAAWIDKELKLATRDFSDVYLALTVSAYGRPLTFLDRDSAEFKKMLSDDGTIKVPQIKKLLHSLNNHTTHQMMISFEKLEVFNNELGLPLYQSISDFDYKAFRLNSVKLDVEPGFFRDERQAKPPTRITAALDAKIGRHNEMLVSTGALLLNERQQVAVGFYKKKLVSLPLKVSLEANLAENRVTVRRSPLHENLLYIRQQPVTFVKSFDPARQATRSGSPAEWRPLYNLSSPAQMRPFKLDYMTPLALGLKLEGRHRAGQDWSMAAWRRYLGGVGLQAAKFMYFYSPTGAPLELRLSTVSTEQNPTRELVEVFSWRHSHQGHSDEGHAQAAEADKELEAFTAAGQRVSGAKPSTVHYKLALLGGSSKERKVELDIGYSRSFDRLLHKWRVFYQRTPLDQAAANPEPTNLCWLGSLRFPSYDVGRLLKLDLLDMDHSANMTSELTFGDECGEAKLAGAGPKASARLTFDWSQEQRGLLEAALRADRPAADAADGEAGRNPFAHLQRACLGARARGGGQLEPACLQLLQGATELTHLAAVLDHREVPERWTRLAGRLGSLYTYARAGYIDEMDERAQPRDYKSADGKQERAHLEANLTAGAHERRLSYRLDSPNYHVLYRNLPFGVPPLSSFPLLDASYYQTVQRRLGSRHCSVSGQSVTTFDNLTYTMPAVGDGCFKLIAKDCSPEANFVVLGAKVGAAKVLKVYVAQKFKVEFVPDKDGRRISDIKVNGDTVAIGSDAPPLKRDTKLGPRTVEAFQIDYNGAFYTLSSKLYKFAVSTDGSWIFVQQSKYYAGKSCGICGDANGDQQLEFKSPSSARRVCRNSDDFVWSYVLPSTCASRPASIECAQ